MILYLLHSHLCARTTTLPHALATHALCPASAAPIGHAVPKLFHYQSVRAFPFEGLNRARNLPSTSHVSTAAPHIRRTAPQIHALLRTVPALVFEGWCTCMLTTPHGSLSLACCTALVSGRLLRDAVIDRG